MVANEQLDIFELERGGFVISPPYGVFTRAEQEEESETYHVGNGAIGDGGSSVRKREAAHHNRERDGLDTVGRRVSFGVAR